MLVTWTRVPPSCAAMLPQKFSAATTCSVLEPWGEVGAERRQVGLASIYRTLDQLSGDGFLQKIELGEGVTRYEPIRAGGEHHHHLVCDGCGKVEAFADERLERALHDVEDQTGYRV